MESLQSQYKHLQSQFVNVNNENSDRKQLLGNGKPSYWQNASDDDDDEPLSNLRPTSSRKPNIDDLRKQQNKILDDQNEGLENLSKVISRQKSIALRIGDEFGEQSGLLQIFFFLISYFINI